MKKIITTALLVGSLMSIFGTSALLADESQTQTIEKKAKAIVYDAKVRADKLVDDAKAKAKAMIEAAKADAAELKKEALKSIILKFSSGNSIPVDRATITYEEMSAIIDLPIITNYSHDKERKIKDMVMNSLDPYRLNNHLW